MSQRLANLIAGKKYILILDGLEVFQNPPGINGGRIQDEALHILLRSLAHNNLGTCILTSRIGFPQLAEFKRSKQYIERQLNGLETKYGAKFLVSRGIKGSIDELERVSDQYKGHCLSLSLLATVLTDVYSGQIVARTLIANPLSVNVDESTHVENMLDHYSEWLHKDDNILYLEVLNVLALFDRPINKDCFLFICNSKTASGNCFAKGLNGKTIYDLRPVLNKLVESHLIFKNGEGDSTVYDTHPIIRNYFCSRLKQLHKDLWKTGCELVFDYLNRNLPYQPNNFFEESALLRSITYGAEYQDINTLFTTQFVDRAMRGNSYATNKLGMYSAVLSTLNSFYVNGDWSKIRLDLSNDNRVLILVETGHELTAVLGYASYEAANCFKAAIEIIDSAELKASMSDVRIKAVLGLCRYYRMKGDLANNKIISDEILLYSDTNKKYRTVARRALCTYYFYSGQFENCITEANLCEDAYDPSIKNELAQLDLNEPYLSCKGYRCMANYLLGNYTSLSEISAVVKEAEALGHAHTIIVVMLMKLMMEQYSEDFTNLMADAQEMISICSSNGFNQWECSAKILLYWARAKNGVDKASIKLLIYEVELWESFGAKLFLPYWYYLISDAYKAFENTKQMKKYRKKANVTEGETGEVWAKDLFLKGGMPYV